MFKLNVITHVCTVKVFMAGGIHTHIPARCVATSIAEPLLAGVAVHHTRRIMDPTVAERRHESKKGLASGFRV